MSNPNPGNIDILVTGPTQFQAQFTPVDHSGSPGCILPVLNPGDIDLPAVPALDIEKPCWFEFNPLPVIPIPHIPPIDFPEIDIPCPDGFNFNVVQGQIRSTCTGVTAQTTNYQLTKSGGDGCDVTLRIPNLRIPCYPGGPQITGGVSISTTQGTGTSSGAIEIHKVEEECCSWELNGDIVLSIPCLNGISGSGSVTVSPTDPPGGSISLQKSGDCGLALVGNIKVGKPWDFDYWKEKIYEYLKDRFDLRYCMCVNDCICDTTTTSTTTTPQYGCPCILHNGDGGFETEFVNYSGYFHLCCEDVPTEYPISSAYPVEVYMQDHNCSILCYEPSPAFLAELSATTSWQYWKGFPDCECVCEPCDEYSHVDLGLGDGLGENKNWICLTDDGAVGSDLCNEVEAGYVFHDEGFSFDPVTDKPIGGCDCRCEPCENFAKIRGGPTIKVNFTNIDCGDMDPAPTATTWCCPEEPDTTSGVCPYSFGCQPLCITETWAEDYWFYGTTFSDQTCKCDGQTTTTTTSTSSTSTSTTTTSTTTTSTSTTSTTTSTTTAASAFARLRVKVDGVCCEIGGPCYDFEVYDDNDALVLDMNNAEIVGAAIGCTAGVMNEYNSNDIEATSWAMPLTIYVKACGAPEFDYNDPFDTFTLTNGQTTTLTLATATAWYVTLPIDNLCHEYVHFTLSSISVTPCAIGTGGCLAIGGNDFVIFANTAAAITFKYSEDPRPGTINIEYIVTDCEGHTIADCFLNEAPPCVCAVNPSPTGFDAGDFPTVTIPEQGNVIGCDVCCCAAKNNDWTDTDTLLVNLSASSGGCGCNGCPAEFQTPCQLIDQFNVTGNVIFERHFTGSGVHWIWDNNAEAQITLSCIEGSWSIAAGASEVSNSHATLVNPQFNISCVNNELQGTITGQWEIPTFDNDCGFINNIICGSFTLTF